MRSNFLPGLPWSSSESIRFGSEGSDGTHINNVAWHLWHEHLLHIRPDLQVVSSSCCSQIFDSCNLTGKTTTNTQKGINVWWPQIICHSICRARERYQWSAHRTQRVHWMQRVMMVLISGPMFLSSTALFPSVKRLRSEPNCMDWSWKQEQAEEQTT